MAILEGYDCSVERLGTGLGDCQPVLGLPTGFILVPKGWSLSKTSGTFNLAYVQSQVQAGNFVPFLNAFDMVGDRPEPTIQTSSSGIESVVRQGKTKFTVRMKKGRAMQAIAYSYNSDNQFDALLTYETGSVLAVESVDGTEIKGITVSMVNTMPYGENTGSESEETTIVFQIADPIEYNRYPFPMTPTAMGFNVNKDVFGITDVYIAITSADVSNDSVMFSVRWLHNKQESITGLDTTELTLYCNGTENGFDTITYDSTTKLYTGTPTTTLVSTQSAVVKTTDGSSGTVAKLGKKFYRGTSAGFTITA